MISILKNDNDYVTPSIIGTNNLLFSNSGSWMIHDGAESSYDKKMLPLSLQEGWPVDSTMKLIETWKGKGYMQLCPFRDHVHPFPWEKQVKPMPWVHIFMVFNGICVERHDCRDELYIMEVMYEFLIE